MIEVQVRPGNVQTTEDFYMGDLCFGCILESLQFFTRYDEAATRVEMQHNYIRIRLVLS